MTNQFDEATEKRFNEVFRGNGISGMHEFPPQSDQLKSALQDAVKSGIGMIKIEMAGDEIKLSNIRQDKIFKPTNNGKGE